MTVEYAGGVAGAGATDGAEDIAGAGATLDVDGTTGPGARSAGSDERWATVITAATNAASTSIPSAPSRTDIDRRSGLKSGNSALCTATDADHGPSPSSGIGSVARPGSGNAPMYSGRVVAVAGVSASASRVAWMEEMALDLRGDSAWRRS